MYEDFIRQRIKEFRNKANVSEYQLSLNLGRSKGYIQSISSGRSLPSMNTFLDICDYFHLTPREFLFTRNNKPLIIT